MYFVYVVGFDEQSVDLGQIAKKEQNRAGWCCLCKSHEETNSHIFMSCTFFVQVWLEVEGQLSLTNLWSKEI
jgi:hypothetical protein